MKRNLAAFLALSLTALSRLLGQSHSVRDLGLGSAFDINNLGQVVGESSNLGFYWDGTNKHTISRGYTPGGGIRGRHLGQGGCDQ